MKKKYSHLFFDLDNTLWDFEKNSYDAMFVVFNKLKMNSFDIGVNHFFDVYSKNNRFCWQEYRLGKLAKKELVVLRFKRTFEELKISGIEPMHMNSLYLEYMPNCKNLVKGAFEILEYLKGKGYSLYIITNGFSEVQHRKLEISGINKFFTKIFISEDIKAPKPSKKIFEHAIKSSNAKKTSSIMIGDDVEADIRGAVEYGIDAVYLGEAYPNSSLISGMKNKQNIYFIQNLSNLSSFF